jgi:signal transduction histidine kinase
VRLPGGIIVRLAIALLVIVGGALLAAYLIVAPSLENRLVAAKLSGLEKAAVPLANASGFSVKASPIVWQSTATIVSVATNSRVAVLSTLTEAPVTLTVGADSSDVGSADVASDPYAVSASEAARRAGEAAVDRGRVTRHGFQYAEVAVARGDGVVVLFSSSLSDTLATVHVIERRLGYAAVVALVIALALGSMAAAFHARRIRRLEQAAERIAQGTFDEPVTDTGDDELAELAHTFERMRVQLSRLDSARRAFVATASHELRTPLFALGGFIELLEDEDLEEETRREFLATMRGQVERLTKLATDLLDLSRVDAGGLAVEHAPVELGELARALGGELRGLAERTGHGLEAAVADDAWAVGDEQRIAQIGRALVGNALTHTPAGTRVVIRARTGDAHAWLEVEDDGPGIPGDHLERVFDRFYRVEEGIAPGTGLGLAIAGELAALMDGRVRATSRPGRTVFTLELARSPAPDPDEQLAVSG